MTQRQSRIAVFLFASLFLGSACGPAADPGEAPPPLAPGAAVEQMRAALALAGPAERHEQVAALLRRSPPEALPGLREAFAEAPLDLGDPELVSFGMWWARFDGEGASDWAVSDWRTAHFPVVKNVFETWAHSDPELAYRRVYGVRDNLREAAMRGAIAGWQRSGQPGLVEAVQSIQDERSRQLVAEHLARRVVIERGIEGAIEWTDSIAERPFQRIMRQRVASAGTELGDAAAMAAWAGTGVTQGDERISGLPRRVGTRWVTRDPEAAFAWLASLPAGKDRDDGVMESYRDWLLHDREAARAWAEQQEIEPWNEPAFALFLRQVADDDPERALADVARFSNEAERNRHTLMLAQRWIDRDPEAAGAWLAEHGPEINDYERGRLEARLAQRRAERAAGADDGPADEEEPALEN